MKLKQLQSQLDELRKKEAIAQTKEQLLNEEKDQLLTEVEELFKKVRPLDIIPDDDIAVNNLSNIIDQIEEHINEEIAKSSIPPELL